MKKSHRVVGFALALAVVITAAVSAQNDALPVVRVALGMESKEVERKSTVAVNLTKTAIGSESFRAFHALIPHGFIYEHPELGFVLPEAKGISMATEAGRIEQININPQLTLLNVEDAIERCRGLVSLLDEKGWKRDRGHLKNLYSGDTLKTYDSLGSVQNAFLDPHLDEKFERVRIASWKNDVERVGLDLERKRYHQKAEANRHAEKKYLITLTFGYSVVPPPWVRGPR